MEDLQNAVDTAFQSGFSTLALAGALMIVVMVFRSAFGRYIKPAYRPLSASICGVIVAISVSLQNNVLWWQAIGLGVVLGTSAGGHWSLWGKHFAKLIGWKDYGVVVTEEKDNGLATKE